jgi:hypothetical protein
MLATALLVPAVLGSHIRRSHTIMGEGQGKWALWQFCPTTEESIKNALMQQFEKFQFSLEISFGTSLLVFIK